MAAFSLSLLQFVDVIGNTVVLTTLPQMLRDVGAPSSASGPVATGYAMTFGGLLMFAARVGDRVGHRRAVLISLAIFAFGAAIAGAAPSVVVLTAGRAVQGAGAALAVPSALSILTATNTDPRRRSRALAGWSAAGAAGGAAGFVVGGIVGGLATWRWIFAGMIVVAAILTWMIMRSVPPDTGRRTGLALNAGGSLLLTGSAMAVVVATTLLPSARSRPVGLAFVAVTVILAVSLRAADARSSAPLLPVEVIRQPLLRRGVLGSLINTGTTSSAITVLTLYLQDTLQHSPIVTAGLLLPFSLAVIVGSAAAPPTIGGVGRDGAVAAGHALIAAGLVLLIIVPDRYVGVAISMALAGAGIGMASVPATSLGTDVPHAFRATASGLLNTGTQLGTAVGTALLLLITAATTGMPAAGTAAPRPAWAVAAGLALLGTIIFASRARLPRPRCCSSRR